VHSLGDDEGRAGFEPVDAGAAGQLRGFQASVIVTTSREICTTGFKGTPLLFAVSGGRTGHVLSGTGQAASTRHEVAISGRVPKSQLGARAGRGVASYFLFAPPSPTAPGMPILGHGIDNRRDGTHQADGGDARPATSWTGSSRPRSSSTRPRTPSGTSSTSPAGSRPRRPC